MRGVAVVVAVYLGLLAGLLVIGNYITIPDEQLGYGSPGGLGSAAYQLIGRGGTTDFLADYASARSMRTGGDAYETLAPMLLRDFDIEWGLAFSNPHPPTQLTLVLPFTAVRYEWALSAWALAMIGVFVATIAVMGVRLRLAVPLGLAIGLAYPGAYAIGNPVPVIGLGMAMAYRFRDRPGLAGLGLALAVSPKVSGLILFLPFAMARRFRACAAGLGILGLMAVIPMAFQPDIWWRYLDVGLSAISLVASGSESSILIRVGDQWGLGRQLAALLLAGCAGVLAVRTRDLYWPLAWLAVAALPIMWLYSLLTFLPLLLHAVGRPGRWTIPLAAAATGLTVASPPLGPWPEVVVPTVVALVFAVLWSARPAGPADALWLPPRLEALLGLDRHLRLDRIGQPASDVDDAVADARLPG